MAKIRLREACKRDDYPSYSKCIRLNKDGKLPLFQFAGAGPLYVDEDDLDALMQPVECDVVATPGPRPPRGVPAQRRGAA